MMVMLKNEEGFILPLMLGIFLIIAALLMMLSSQLEVKVASYARTQDYLRMNVLEQEGLSVLEGLLLNIKVTDDMENVSEFFSLSRGARIEVNISFLENSLEIDYQIVYNNFIRQRRLLYSFDYGLIFLE
jgi:hypothetical protein